MRCQALRDKKRVFVFIEPTGKSGIVIMLPNGDKYYIVRNQVLKAIGVYDHGENKETYKQGQKNE